MSEAQRKELDELLHQLGDEVLRVMLLPPRVPRFLADTVRPGAKR